MKLIVKAHGHGTVHLEVEGTWLTGTVALAAARKAIAEEFGPVEQITVFEAENVNHGSIFSVAGERAIRVR